MLRQFLGFDPTNCPYITERRPVESPFLNLIDQRDHRTSRPTRGAVYRESEGPFPSLKGTCSPADVCRNFLPGLQNWSHNRLISVGKPAILAKPTLDLMSQVYS